MLFGQTLLWPNQNIVATHNTHAHTIATRQCEELPAAAAEQNKKKATIQKQMTVGLKPTAHTLTVAANQTNHKHLMQKYLIIRFQYRYIEYFQAFFCVYVG